MVIDLRDVSRVEQLMTDVLKAGVNGIDDIDFRSTQIRKHKDQARVMAIRAAREKAVALTGEIGQTIGKAYSIVEEGTSREFSNSVGSNTRSSVGGNYSETEGTIALGQISISARVVVSFELK